MPNRPPLPYEFLPQVPSFELTSDDLAPDGGWLPDDQVLAHGNVSPRLRWSGASDGTRGYVVTCYDPDAPTGSGFWHWSLVNLPATTTELPRGAGTGEMVGLPAGAFHVRNDYGTRDFGGAAPPPFDPPHRYVFAVHAIDVDALDVTPDVSPATVGFNLRLHTVGRALLINEYGTGERS
jgi:Raf kinase inhibitor-like YbhB/YbcL family protein